MEGQQRGARKNCSGTVDNLIIDKNGGLGLSSEKEKSKRNLDRRWKGL